MCLQCQASDWKGSHKALCKSIRNAVELHDGNTRKTSDGKVALSHKHFTREILQVNCTHVNTHDLAGQLKYMLQCTCCESWLDTAFSPLHAVQVFCVARQNGHAPSWSLGCSRASGCAALIAALFLQGYQHPAVRRFWLAVYIKALDSTNAMVSSTCASALCWFLWHFTASSVPVPLRAALRRSADAFRGRMVHCPDLGGHPRQTQPCTRLNCAHRLRLEMAWMLQWLLATDPAMANLPATGVAASEALPSGAALQELQGNLLEEVGFQPLA